MASEIITGSSLAAAVGVKLIYDVCGPTAKYWGGELTAYSKIGAENVRRIFENAAHRLKTIGKFEGQVPPRVLKAILSDGYYCEDELQALYLGGVLASSKGPVSRDDRAIAYCSLVNSLSSYQLRTHCIIYSALLRATHFKVGGTLTPIKALNTYWINKHGLTVAIREVDYQLAMDFSTPEQPANIGQHSFVGLEEKGLCKGGVNVCQPQDKNEEPFRYFYPTLLGIELFLWGLGIGDYGLEEYRPELLKKTVLPFVVTPYETHAGHVSFS